MKLLYLYIHFTFMLFALGFAKPSENKKKELSGKEHYHQDHHNAQYDHEAFLGKDARTFDELPPEESKRRLSLLVDKIDTDKDKKVSHEELTDWIRFTHERTVMEDVETQWKQQNPENKETLAWEAYKNLQYGSLNQNDSVEAEKDKEELKRVQRRWSAADKDGDNSLNKQEYTAFLHPHDIDYMTDTVVLEIMEDLDQDRDGKISFLEYIAELKEDEEDDEEPEWVEQEREEFRLNRDKDGDNFMDQGEVKRWLQSENFAEEESRHLIYEADSDGDQRLTKEEILNNYDLFVGSHATDFGDVLIRHDEF